MLRRFPCHQSVQPRAASGICIRVGLVEKRGDRVECKQVFQALKLEDIRAFVGGVNERRSWEESEIGRLSSEQKNTCTKKVVLFCCFSCDFDSGEDLLSSAVVCHGCVPLRAPVPASLTSSS